MNNEIKEMLELHIKNDIDLLPKNQKTVLDYITNLQHTEDLYNQLLKDYDEEVEENIKLTKLWKNEVEKRRKGVEYIKQSINESQLIFGWNDMQRYHDYEMKELIDILNDRSDE